MRRGADPWHSRRHEPGRSVVGYAQQLRSPLLALLQAPPRTTLAARPAAGDAPAMASAADAARRHAPGPDDAVASARRGYDRAMHEDDKPAPASGPLQGLKVVELGQLIAGPFAAKTLADFGADVIKVEPPGAGDPLRKWRLLQGRHLACGGRCSRATSARVALDLRQAAEAQDIVRQLATKPTC